VLVGGPGRDLLKGDSGADIFDFNALRESVVGRNRDVVTFFHKQDDRIDLKGIDADTDGTRGNQAFKWVDKHDLDARFTGADGQLRLARGILQGDVNGDRRADVIVGASGFDARGRRDSGAAYVVLGRRRTGRVALERLGSGGFRIDGGHSRDRAGDAVGITPDLNGDGRGDLLVGASRADAGGLRDAGSAYAVFGKTGSGGIDLRALGDAGFSVDGGAEDDSAGIAVSGLGDLNADGLGDLLVGAFGTTSFGRTSSSSFISHGR
jgi:hypothetical protein